jgi:hypothetical protein
VSVMRRAKNCFIGNDTRSVEEILPSSSRQRGVRSAKKSAREPVATPLQQPCFAQIETSLLDAKCGSSF